MTTIVSSLKRSIKDQKATFGVYVGRLCPMHLGHQALIGALFESLPNDHIVFVGSCNMPISIRHLFTYTDRADFISAVFPEVRVMPLPDFGNNEVWFRALDDLIKATGGDPTRTIFIGGCKEDVEFYYENGRMVHIVNRFSGVTSNVSGTQVRDAMIERRTLEGLLDPKIFSLVQSRFSERWNEVRSR